MIIKRLQVILHPERYQGWGKARRYFEGWYYKILNADESKAFAKIPGIAIDETGTKQAFIQILDGKNRSAEYHKFDFAEFKPQAGKFNIRIKNNTFTSNHIDLDLPSVKGMLEFENQIHWPSSWRSPGIMGPYTFVPYMECYHGILSMDHIVRGSLEINNVDIDFTNGRGYMEKDWGKSFPSAYTWMQTNHFSEPGISFKASVAKIPWMRSSFVGFIAGIWLNDRLIQFTTYNSSRIRKCLIDREKVELVMENKNYRLEVHAHREEVTELASPIMGLMDGKIEESMSSKIDVQITDKKNNKLLLEDTGRNAGLEVSGKVEEIFIR